MGPKVTNPAHYLGRELPQIKQRKKKVKLRNKGMSAVDLVYFAIVVIVGISIFSNVDTSLNSGVFASATTAAVAAKGNISANTYGGFQTISSGPTVIAAVVILGIVALLMYRK